MHLVLNWKQFNHVNPGQLSAQTSKLHMKSAVSQVVLTLKNLVKFMDFFGRCTAHLVCFQLYIYVPNAQIMFSRLKTPTGEAFF